MVIELGIRYLQSLYDQLLVIERYLVIELVVRNVGYSVDIAWLHIGYTKLVVVWL